MAEIRIPSSTKFHDPSCDKCKAFRLMLETEKKRVREKEAKVIDRHSPSGVVSATSKV